MRHNWEKTLVRPETPLLEGIKVLDAAATQILLVVDADRRLLGTVTDGNIRRGLLHGISLSNTIGEVMNTHPHVARAGEDRAMLMAMMRRDRLRALPLVDTAKRVVGLEILDDLLEIKPADNWVVLMAGGEGRRLYPLTKETPKPLLRVGSKPILETIMGSFIASGFRKFFISVNYLAEQVEAHFGDGSARGVEIQYLREDRKLGTAGALRLLPERPTQPFFVMNGDILTNTDLAQLLRFHTDHSVTATMCVREHVIQVPYGVVELDGHRMTSIIEKPITRHFVNAGIYVLEPSALDTIPTDAETFDMPQLFDSLRKNGGECGAFPIREYWLDIGRHDDFERANIEFPGMFL